MLNSSPEALPQHVREAELHSPSAVTRSAVTVCSSKPLTGIQVPGFCFMIPVSSDEESRQFKLSKPQDSNQKGQDKPGLV